MSRRASSARRRREILDAALECFSSRGYNATTMADIRERAGASTGSIYHHFKGKEQLAAALYLEGVQQTQENGLDALLAQQSAEQGIRALVESYLEWVESHPKLAAFLFNMRHADFLEPVEETIAEMNEGAFEAATDWFRARIESSELPNLGPDVFRAILYGPVAHFARRWVSAGSDTDIGTAKQQLAQATWDALRGAMASDGRVSPLS